MSLSLSLGKATPQEVGHVELPATASRLPDDPSQFRRDPCDTRLVQGNSQSGSQLQRATAATRSRRTATNTDAYTPAITASSHTPSKLIIPATPSLPPSAAAAAAFSASATVAGPAHTVVDDAIDLTAANANTKGRSSRKKSTSAAQATSSAAAALAADLPPPIPLPVDDHSTSFFTDFKLALNENLNGAFHLFGHIDGDGKELLCLLLQKSPAVRIYRFQGRLNTLRPEALSSRGMHGKEYRIHVENGLRTQDSTSYEHEFSVNEVGLSETEGAPLIQAELKLFKQMGTSATVRIPVCLAHIRFEPMSLVKSSPKPIEQVDQDDGEFKARTVELIHALNEWSAQIGTRTSAQKMIEKQLVAQISVASSLLPQKSAAVNDLTDDASDLMKHMLRVLNQSKVAIREQRERKQVLEAQKMALHKKLYPSKEEEEDYDSESDESVLSASDEEHDADGDHHMEVDEEKKYQEEHVSSRPALTSAISIPSAVSSTAGAASAAASSSASTSGFAVPRAVSPIRRGRSKQQAPSSGSNLVAAPSSAAPSALPPSSTSIPTSQFMGMPPSLSFPNSIDPVSAHATPFSPSQLPAASFIPSPPNSGSGRSQRAVSNLTRANANSFSASQSNATSNHTETSTPPPRAPITNVRKRARVVQPSMPPPPAVSKPDAFSASLHLTTGTNSRSMPSRRASNDILGAGAAAAASRDQHPSETSQNKPMTNVSQLLREVGNSPHSRRQPHDTPSGIAQPSAPQPSKRQKR